MRFRHVLLSTILFTSLACVVRADSATDTYVSVSIPVASFSLVPGQSIAMSFDWDVTTSDIFNIVTDIEGPAVFTTPPDYFLFDGGGNIQIIDFFNGTQRLQAYQPDLIFPIGSAPGTYNVKWELIGNPDFPGPNAIETTTIGVATVTSIADPIAVAEPATLVLLLAGLMAFAVLERNRLAPIRLNRA